MYLFILVISDLMIMGFLMVLRNILPTLLQSIFSLFCLPSSVLLSYFIFAVHKSNCFGTTLVNA